MAKSVIIIYLKSKVILSQCLFICFILLHMHLFSFLWFWWCLWSYWQLSTSSVGSWMDSAIHPKATVVVGVAMALWTVVADLSLLFTAVHQTGVVHNNPNRNSSSSLVLHATELDRICYLTKIIRNNYRIWITGKKIRKSKRKTRRKSSGFN
jgi:hypothetical protein